MSSFIPIRYGEEDFVRRIEERTNGEREPIGLLLSGGSARAFAHIGVIEYLEELHIVPDYIISNSMGSIVGILYAAGLNSTQMYEISKNLNISTLFDITLPIAGGVLDNSKFVSFVSSYIQEGKELQDLDIPIMVITEDIATKRQVRLMEGDIQKVLSASFALPVYFPPVEFRGHMLIDGGIINLAPVEIAYEYGDKVIVSSTFYEGKGINLKDAISVLNLSLDIGKRRFGAISLDSHPDAVWIRCDVEDFSFMAFDKVEELREKGYDSAKAMSNELKALVHNIPLSHDVSSFGTFDVIHKTILDDYYLFNSIKTSGSTNHLFTGVKSFSQQKDQKNLLRDENIFGVRYGLSFPVFQTSVLGGVAWKNSAISNPFGDILLHATFTPFSFVSIEGDFLVSFDDGLAPRYYQRAELKFREQFYERSLLAELSARFEQQNESNFSIKESIVDSGLSLWYRGHNENSIKVNSRISYQLGSSFTRHFLNSAVAIQTRIANDFLFSFSYHGRYALDANGDVPFYTSDEYYSTSNVINDQGRGGTANNTNYLITSGLEFSYSPKDFVPSFSETLLLKNSSVGVFGQAIWFEEDIYIPHVLFGVKMGTTFSLLGLKELSSSLYVAYDTYVDGITFGINLGVTAWN
jgi:NTE family protein